jgi:hypothetical protein
MREVSDDQKINHDMIDSPRNSSRVAAIIGAIVEAQETSVRVHIKAISDINQQTSTSQLVCLTHKRT